MIVFESFCSLYYFFWYLHRSPSASVDGEYCGEVGDLVGASASDRPTLVGLYCGDVGEYCGDVGEYCGDVGEYAGDVGLYAGDVGEYAGDVGEYAGDVGEYAGDVGE